MQIDSLLQLSLHMYEEPLLSRLLNACIYIYKLYIFGIFLQAPEPMIENATNSSDCTNDYGPTQDRMRATQLVWFNRYKDEMFECA